MKTHSSVTATEYIMQQFSISYYYQAVLSRSSVSGLLAQVIFRTFPVCQSVWWAVEKRLSGFWCRGSVGSKDVMCGECWLAHGKGQFLGSYGEAHSNQWVICGIVMQRSWEAIKLSFRAVWSGRGMVCLESRSPMGKGHFWCPLVTMEFSHWISGK